MSPPGDTLLEALEQRGMSQDELARRIGLTRKHVNRVIAGEAPITPDTALKLEHALGIRAHFWNNREQQYRDFLARKDERDGLTKQIEWLRSFPIQRMAQLGWIEAVPDKVEQLQRLLGFFGVASPDAWREYWQHVQVAYRKSARFEPDACSLAAWLRQGEIVAQSIPCLAYNRAKFNSVLREIRGLTTAPPDVFVPKMTEMCASCGVAVAFVPELPKTASGATRWLSPERALLQLSLKYKTDDHLWFTFFHEAGHILLHQKKAIFLESGTADTREEQAADAFAAEMLIPQEELQAFIAQGRPSLASIRRFAQQLGIAPGILVGQLQHKGAIPFSHYNQLKQTFEWESWRTPFQHLGKR